MKIIIAGLPSNNTASMTSRALEAIYLSLTAFATLGFGDITYSASQPWMRIVTSLEAWAGAIMVALFVTLLARKMFR